jgi:membrane protease YdiL (CAAX protease family)
MTPEKPLCGNFLIQSYRCGEGDIQMNDYSVSRRVWRAIYPILIDVMIMLLFRWVLPLVVLPSTYYLFGTHFVVLTYIITIAVFLPLWMKTRDETPVYVNRSFPRLVILTIGLCAGIGIYISLFTDITGRLVSGIAAAAIVPRAELLLWVDLLSTCALAPIGEELCHRGVIQNRLDWLPKWAAVLFGATVFALRHMEPTLILNAFPFGILMGVLYLKFRSIIVVIAGHATFNVIAWVLNYVKFDPAAPRIVALVVPIVLVFAAPICAYLLFKFPAAAKIAAPDGGNNLEV